MSEDLKVYKKIDKSGFKTKIEHIYYNLDKKVAEITVCEEREEDVSMVDEERFISDKTIIRNLVRKENKNLEKKIKNNNLVIALSVDNPEEVEKATKHLNPEEVEKATKHLNKNKNRLERIKNYINGN
jgi:hypothetical protein